jgi:8-oxo-dGTP diphosphatase
VNKDRAAAQAKWHANAPKKIVGTKLIIKSDKGTILLVKAAYKNSWQFPGGGADANESPIDAVVREISEELGLTIRADELQSLGIVYDHKNDAVLCVYEYQKMISEDTVIHIQEEELNAYQFFGPTEVADLISDYYVDFWKSYAKL